MNITNETQKTGLVGTMVTNNSTELVGSRVARINPTIVDQSGAAIDDDDEELLDEDDNLLDDEDSLNDEGLLDDDAFTDEELLDEELYDDEDDPTGMPDHG